MTKQKRNRSAKRQARNAQLKKQNGNYAAPASPQRGRRRANRAEARSARPARTRAVEAYHSKQSVFRAQATNGSGDVPTARKRDPGAAPSRPRRRGVAAARYDVLNDRGLKDHWRWIDSRSVDASLDSDTRRRLRERARYEVANNSYAFGVALAIANAVIGSGPRVQIVGNLDPETTHAAELAFANWQDEVGLAEKLRAMRFSRFQDGEAFATFHNNAALESPVKLDIQPLDCERVAAPYAYFDPFDVDGVKLNEFGTPTEYRVLTMHPGDDPCANFQGVGRTQGTGTAGGRGTAGGSLAARGTADAGARIVPARYVVHWYRRSSSEQHRGVTELAASLNLFALLRRYTLAVVTAAETAADFAALLYTDEADAAQQGQAFEELELKRGVCTTLPEGWKITQLKAEQPTTTYQEFKRELLGEIGRSLQVPVNIIMGDSARYNYASGRLDHQEFQKMIRIDQANASRVVMRPIFREWWAEYAAINALDRKTPDALFYWDGFEHVDPVKEANAQAVRLGALTSNLSIEYGKQGRDWEDELIQIARERRKMQELGLALPVATPSNDTDDQSVEQDSPADS